jgi:hypothetical protein
MIVIDLGTVLKDIFGDLDGSLDPVNGQLILTEFFQANGAIDNGVNESSIVYVFLSDLDTLVILLLCLVEQLVFV